MDLFIEKEFLDNFYIEFDSLPIQNIVKLIFTEYGNKTVYMDVSIDNPEDLEKLKKDNIFFALFCSNDKVPIPTPSLEEKLLNSDFSQTLVFTNDNKDWFEEAENNGALCFSFDNYEERIEVIISKLHFKIDLSEDFQGWNFIDVYKNIKYNYLSVSDGYILKDTNNQGIKYNLIPILKNFICDTQRNIKITILTTEILNKKFSDDQVRNKVKTIYTDLNRVFANYNVKFSIFKIDANTKFNFHDRTIFTNFSILESGVGFDLKKKKSNSQIISETIFNKYTYNRLRRNRDEQISHINKLRSGSYNSINFYMYPE